jgi:hypothetical protein
MKTKWLAGAMSLVIAATVVGCGEKTPEQTPPVFPDKKEVKVSAGTRAALEFTATHDWKLKVVAGDWLRFVSSESDVTGTAEKTGAAGSVSAPIYVSDAGLEDFIESKAEVELTMEGTTKIVFEVVRAPRIVGGAAMYTRDDDGKATEIDAIEFAFNDGSRSVSGVSVGFSAKWDWEVSSLPEGVSFEGDSFTGGQYVSPSAAADFKIFTVDQASIPFALPATAKVVIRNRQNTAETVEFPVTYAGITNGDVVAVSPQNRVTQGVSYSKEGYVLQGGTGEPYSDNRTEETATVLTQNLDYTLAVVEYTVAGETETAKELTGDDNWVNFTDDEKGNITFGVDENTGDERVAYLLVLPPAKAADAKLNDGAWVGAIVRARQGAIKITQQTGKVATSGGFFVGWGSMQDPVPAGAVNQDFSLLGGNPPSNWATPTDPTKIWIYIFSNDDINNSPVIAPLDFPGQQWEFVRMIPTPMGLPQLSGVTISAGSTAYPEGMMKPGISGVRLNGITPTTDLKASLLLFYKEDYMTTIDGERMDLMNKRADAALLIIQQP